MPVVVWHHQTVEGNHWRRGRDKEGKGAQRRGKEVCVCHVEETHIVPSNSRLQVF